MSDSEKKKKIKSESSKEYGRMPRILSAALNVAGLGPAAWTMSLIAHNGLYTMNGTGGPLFHTVGAKSQFNQIH